MQRRSEKVPQVDRIDRPGATGANVGRRNRGRDPTPVRGSVGLRALFVCVVKSGQDDDKWEQNNMKFVPTPSRHMRQV